ncbi:hypothetical protein [Propionivibrio sp.]|uniref:hypothetical protein n=1 Tax=Propionivibrio sp. TaxID=2212460 RepID=UPI003BEF93B6
MTPQFEEALRLLRLAERDRDVFEILAGRGDNAHAAAGFHAQQAVIYRHSGLDPESRFLHLIKILKDLLVINELALHSLQSDSGSSPE